MNLDDTQRAKVSEWVEQGLKLSDIQSKLASELGLRLTYMDVRFLIDDLKLRLKDVEPAKPAEPVIGGGPKDGQAAGQAENEPIDAPLEPLPDEIPAQPGGGAVSVSVDQIARANALVSGKVTFSDGKSAEWYLDQYGRLGLAPQEKGYRPSQQDVMAFQTQLQSQLAKLGY